MTAALLHELDTIDVGDLHFSVAPPTGRKALEIVVDRDASLVLKAPDNASPADAERFVASKRSWIYRKLAEKDALIGPPITKQFVDGEGFAYLGRSFRLTLDASVDTVRLDRGRFVMSPASAVAGSAAMRQWYVRTGTPWLRRRVAPWAARMGFRDVEVVVSDLGYRWGSARPLHDDDRINIHWVTLQLPPSLIDYVLVHELAHLTQPNHTPDYWALVARAMPGYEAQKTALSSIGKNVWMG